MRKINEIFYSIQGEGMKAGLPSVFIRFSGCNLNCCFCDTRHEEGRMMTDEEIFLEVNNYGLNENSVALIVLTGGEPSLHIDEDFIRGLKEATKLPVAIETNGTRPLPPLIDWVTVSPKIGVSPSGNSEISKDILADELKVVDVGQDLKPYFELPCVGPSTHFLLQPCYVADLKLREENIIRTVKRVLENPEWRLSLQTHRFLNIK